MAPDDDPDRPLREAPESSGVSILPSPGPGDDGNGRPSEDPAPPHSKRDHRFELTCRDCGEVVVLKLGGR